MDLKFDWNSDGTTPQQAHKLVTGKTRQQSRLLFRRCHGLLECLSADKATTRPGFVGCVNEQYEVTKANNVENNSGTLTYTKTISEMYAIRASEP